MEIFLTNLCQVPQLKLLSDCFANIIGFRQLNECFFKMNQFDILCWTIKVQNRNAIIDLKSETFDLIINDDNILEWSVLNYSQILDQFSFLSFKTIISAKKIVNKSSLKVELLHDFFSIFSCGSSENVQVEVFWQVLEELTGIWSDIKLKRYFTIINSFIDFLSWWKDQCLIQIKKQKFLFTALNLVKSHSFVWDRLSIRSF